MGLILSSTHLQVELRAAMDEQAASVQPVMESERGSLGLLPFFFLLSSLNRMKKMEGMNGVE